MAPSLLERLRRKAAKSPARFRVAALGLNRAGVVVAVGFSRQRYNRAGGGWHAEDHIFRVARKRGVVEIIICRVGKSGVVRPIEPCRRCSHLADVLGITIRSVA